MKKRTTAAVLLSALMVAGTVGSTGLRPARAQEDDTRAVQITAKEAEKSVEDGLELLKDKLEKLIAENAELKSANVALNADQVMLTEHVTQLQTQVDELTARAEEAETALSSLESEKSQLEKAKKKLEKTKKELEVANTVLEEENARLTEEKSLLEGQVNEALSMIETAKAPALIELPSEEASSDKDAAAGEEEEITPDETAADGTETSVKEEDSQTEESGEEPENKEKTASGVTQAPEEKSEEEPAAEDEAAENGEKTPEADETALQTDETVKEDSDDLVSMKPVLTQTPPTKQAGPVLNEPAFDVLYIGSDIIVSVQTALNEYGYNCGSVDGVLGSGTADQISYYQNRHGMQVTGTVTNELVARLLGLEMPGSQEVIQSTENSNVPMEDAAIIQFDLSDVGREEESYHVGVGVSARTPSTVTYLKYRMVYYDQGGTRLGEDTRTVSQITPGETVQADSWLTGSQAVWDVAAAGIASYEYRLAQPDDYGFNEYHIDLMTGLVTGFRI